MACMHYTYMWESIAWPHHFIVMEVWVHKTSLTMPPFIEVPVPSHEREWLCISAKVIEFVSFYHFSIGCWKCSDSVVFFYWLMEMFRQCGIFLLVVGNVPTVWYFSIGCWKCSDRVVFFYWLLEMFDSVVFFYWLLEMFWQCGIFVFNLTLYQVTFSFLVFCKRFHWCNCSSRACFTSEKCNVRDGIRSWNSRIVRHRFTNWAKGDLYKCS